jgi:hypothetical protein
VFAAQVVWHAPSEQVAPAFGVLHSLSGSVCVVTFAQVPSALPVLASEQAWHVEAQAVTQQTTSTQLFDVHCDALVHGAKEAWSGTHAPPPLQ